MSLIAGVRPRGANVVINSRKASECEATVKSIIAAGGKAIAVGADVSKKAEVTAMVAETVKQFGGVDILVNNAGIEGPPCLLKDLPEEQWDRVLGVNLKGVFLCCQAVIPAMNARGQGRIVNIGSTASIRMTFFGGADYTVSKHGVTGLTQHLAWELADQHITVNTVCPGGVQTPLMESSTTPEYRETVTKRLIPLGRFCTIEEIGEAASFLASDRAAMVDPDFGKQQLKFMLQDHYMQPNGQIPAYEWNFGDVDPPVHAWATIFSYCL